MKKPYKVKLHSLFLPILVLVAFVTPLINQSAFSSDVVRNLLVEMKEDKWKLLSYSSIPANVVTFKEEVMTLEVKNSASPIIYPLPQGLVIKSISLDLFIDGEISLDKVKQGQKGADDFRFRLGLVYEGEQTLNFFQRAVAPKWITEMHALAGKNQGVDKIIFFNTYQDSTLAGQSRVHPLSDLLIENFSLLVGDDKAWQSITINEVPKGRVLGLWLSSDGDDTNSSYEIRLKKLTLRY